MERSNQLMHIKKEIKVEDYFISFEFIGQKNTSEDINNIMNVVDIWLQSVKTYADFKRIALNLKNIFRSFVNKHLRLAVKSKDQAKWGISFVDDKLAYFQKQNIIYNNNSKKISLVCDIEKNKEASSFNNASKTIQEVANEIRDLDYTSEEISDLEKVLYQIYLLFYGKKPDVISPCFSLQVQLMIFILRELCGLNIFYAYNFLPSKEEIKSDNLDILIKKFQSFGYFDSSEVKVVLDENLEAKIFEIGLIIRHNLDINNFYDLKYLFAYLYYEKNKFIYNNENFHLEEDLKTSHEYIKTIANELKALTKKK